MSRPAKRPRVSHQAAAAKLREHPNEWQVVGTYSSVSGPGMASHIRTAFLIAYEPAGAFDARTEVVEDGTRVHARYIGETA